MNLQDIIQLDWLTEEQLEEKIAHNAEKSTEDFLDFKYTWHIKTRVIDYLAERSFHTGGDVKMYQVLKNRYKVDINFYANSSYIRIAIDFRELEYNIPGGTKTIEYLLKNFIQNGIYNVLCDRMSPYHKQEVIFYDDDILNWYRDMAKQVR